MWDQAARLRAWFAKLTPERRLEVAMEIEQFRREARRVQSRGRTAGDE